ncbi:hypothetical protein AKJ16_DCAP18845 [Drosera capensis]
MWGKKLQGGGRITARMDWSQLLPIRSMGLKRVGFGPAFCSSSQAAQPALEQNEGGIMCEPCRGMGWLLCDFCNGQKTNVKSKTSRIYRRCPTCKAVTNDNRNYPVILVMDKVQGRRDVHRFTLVADIQEVIHRMFATIGIDFEATIPNRFGNCKMPRSNLVLRINNREPK